MAKKQKPSRPRTILRVGDIRANLLTLELLEARNEEWEPLEPAFSEEQSSELWAFLEKLRRETGGHLDFEIYWGMVPGDHKSRIVSVLPIPNAGITGEVTVSVTNDGTEHPTVHPEYEGWTRLVIEFFQAPEL